MFIGWFIAAIANGIVLALYAARTPKMGAFTLVGGINGLAFMLTGHYFWTLLGSIILGFIADLIITKATSVLPDPSLLPTASSVSGFLCLLSR